MAIYQGFNKYDIQKLTNIPVDQVQWYINRVTAEDSMALSQYGDEILFSEVAKTVGQYNEFIKECNSVMQDAEAYPKDKLEAIKIKSELITTKIGILSSGIVGNIKEIAKDKEKYSRHPPGIQGETGKPKDNKQDSNDKTKVVVLRKDKPNRRLLPKSQGGTTKTSRHNATVRDDAISNTTTTTSYEEEGD